ncbi:thioester reductase domain-containing protein [Paenibacillus sp. FSL K6-1217]|uniref:thioester reductase domain-containing protein n=1 Tax=Paenibacillus sp. FSL K6-1217 TaxID=2921466 RepID=UPI003255B742
MPHNIFVLSSFTADLLEAYLEEDLKRLQLNSTIGTGPYNQIISQCLDRSSLLYQKKPDYLVVWTRLEDIIGRNDFYLQESFDSCKGDISMLIEAVLHAKAAIHCKLIVMLPPVYENRPLGVGDLQIVNGAMETSMLLRKFMMDKLRFVEGVYLADGEELIRRYGADQSYHMGMYAFAKAPYVNGIYKEAARQISRIIKLDLNNKRNILVIDADILLCEQEEQEEQEGPAVLHALDEQRIVTDDSYLLFQSYLKEIVKWGNELLLCSRSTQEQLHAILDMDDLIITKEECKYMSCECETIPEAIMQIHREHGVSLDQFIVLDTKELHLNGIRQLQLPDDSTLWMQSIEASGVLDYISDKASYSSNDEDALADNTEEYSLEEFLDSMNLEVSVREINELQAEKVGHILHHTKDFNLTGLLWTEEEIIGALNEENKVIYSVKVQDRFGDYGIAGTVIGTVDKKSFTVDALLLNCRVLGKNVEYYLIKELVKGIREHQCDSIVFHFQSNGRNESAAQFLSKITRTDLQRVHTGEALTVSCERAEAYAKEALNPKPIDKGPEQPVHSFDPYRFILNKWNKMGGAEKEQINDLISSTKSIEDIMRAIADSKMKTRTGIKVEYIQPRTETEQKIADLWAEILNLDKVGVLDNFFELGGTSLMAAQLIVKFKNAFDIHLPVRIFFDSSSIEQMAMYIEAITSEQNKHDINESAVSNFRYKTREFLKNEVWLDENITGSKELQEWDNTRIQNVLLTGVTGFLGAFLLQELITMTDYHMVLLVRADSVQSGYDRVVANMEQYNLWDEAYRSRIEVCTGDLSKPLLGQSLQGFNELAVHIDSIYHAGAITNFLEPYNMIKDVNVQGAQEILRLASTHKLKQVHYVSTHYVFSTLSHENGYIAYEDTIPSNDEVLVLGYQQSKWVSERIMALAKERGIPVSIYRVGRISGSSTTGACQTRDIMWLMIKSCVEAGVLFEENVNIEFIPVDYVSKSIIALSIQAGSSNKNFHIVASKMNTLNQVYDWMNRYGFKVEKMPYEQWKDELIERVARNPNLNTTKAMLPFIPEDMGEWDVEITYDITNVKKGLSETAITCPEVGEEVFNRYLDYFVQTKYFQFIS